MHATHRRALRSRIALAALAVFAQAAVAVSPPQGWTRSPANGVETFTPPDLATDEVFTITVHPAGALRGQALTAWLDAWTAGKVPGKPEGQAVAEPGNGGRSATSQVMFRDAANRALIAMFIAVSLDGDRVRALRLVATPKPALFARQKPAIGQFVELLAKDEASSIQPGAAAGPATSPGTATATTGATGGSYVENSSQDARAALARAGVPRGSRAGGPFRYGTYDFEFPRPAVNEVTRYRISFYENGEWRRVAGTTEETGKLVYDPATGAANISVTLDLWNSRYDEADFCRFYLAPDGRAYVYAENEYGLGTFRITGRYVGPNERPNPSAEQAAKRAARTEAERFKWVTPPGRGVPATQVAAVLYRLEQVYGVGGLQLEESAYLLLRDGSAYDGLRCPPDQLDVAASRRQEPRRWGRWRKAGADFELQFARRDGTPGRWEVPPMTTIARPAAPGERLRGRFEKASSFQIPGGAGTVSYRGITFTGDGRFETDFFNMTGGTVGYGDQRIAAGAVANDEGATSSVGGPNFGGGSTIKSNRPKSERTGRYQLDGYALLLQFDDGRSERLPFFFARAGQDRIWFRDAVYSIERR